MKKIFFCSMLFLALATAVPTDGFSAQEQITCCCDMVCDYGGAIGKVTIKECNFWWLSANFECDAATICKKENWPFQVPAKSVSGDCTVDCPSETVLGRQHRGLSTLRGYRDTRLAKIAVGQKLKNLYYAYATPLSQTFMENPSLLEHAKELLEKLVPRIKASMSGRLKGPVLAGELYDEAEMLLDEINIVLESPLKNELLSLKDEARTAGLVE